MKRLIYSPDVKAYVKSDTGIIDLSSYIVSGQVTRRVNQVSSAALTIRNPDFRFTYDVERKKKTGEVYPVLHPMDPIFITMSRYHDKETLVFTGYLDETPYLQLYPGTCDITASCTLKKLNLTWFDPGLNFTINFMAKNGWNQTLDGQMTQAAGPQSTEAVDSSFANLLFETLIELGGWDGNQIYVQPLPPGIGNVGEKLYAQIQKENKESADEVSALLRDIIGTASYGGGGTVSGPGGTQTGPVDLENGDAGKKIFCYFLARGFSPAQAAGFVGNFKRESNLDPTAVQNSNGTGGHGLAQWDDRFGALKAFANKKGKEWTDFQTQLEFAWFELKGSESAAYNAIKATNSVEQATIVIDDKYERSGVKALDERIKYAKAAYNAYNGKCQSSTQNSSSKDEDDDKSVDNPLGNSKSSAVIRSASRGGGSTDSNNSTTDLFSAAKYISDKGLKYVYGGGHGAKMSDLAKETNRDGLDCSSSSSLALYIAGFLSDSMARSSPGYYNWGSPGRGKDFTVWTKASHMYIEFHGEHAGYQFNTSGHSGVSGPRLGKFDYPYNGSPESNGFMARHFTGNPSGGVDVGEDGATGNTQPAERPNAEVKASNPNVQTRTKKAQLIVLHSTESPNSTGTGDISGTNSFLQSKGLSVQVVTDAEGKSGDFVPDDTKYAKHCADYNDVSFGIEQIGHAAQSSWPEAQYEIAAKWIAYWSDKHGIPIQKASVTDTPGGKVNKPGVIRHSDLGLSGSAGEGRSDPGPNYDLNKVMEMAKSYAKGGSAGTSGGTDGAGGAGAGVQDIETVKTIARSAAYSTYLEGPTLEEVIRSNYLRGRKSMMNDKPLMPFIEEICTASQRQFMSLPNGNFFAFYPDYFGTLGRVPYWEIDDVEILDGKIQLSDDALTTHVYVVGDNSPGPPGGQPQFLNEIRSAGVVTIFDAFTSGFVDGVGLIEKTKEVVSEYNKESAFTNKKPADVEYGYNKTFNGKEFHLSNFDDAVKFVERYGLRPKYIDSPLIRNPFFEMFAAYQQFQLLWSQQFLTQFSFTFMPELFPGGLVAMPQHGISLYVEEVTHSFDYTSGFQTEAQLSSPSALIKDEDGEYIRSSQGLIRPLNDPIKK